MGESVLESQVISAIPLGEERICCEVAAPELAASLHSSQERMLLTELAASLHSSQWMLLLTELSMFLHNSL